jgi:hypothetical protein
LDKVSNHADKRKRRELFGPPIEECIVADQERHVIKYGAAQEINMATRSAAVQASQANPNQRFSDIRSVDCADAAFGNSSADDQQMLEYVKAGSGAGLSGLVMHDDATREYA